MLDKRLSKIGRIMIESNGQILCSGFEADDCMCREVAILAMLYGAELLMNEARACIQTPGGNDLCGVD